MSARRGVAMLKFTKPRSELRCSLDRFGTAVVELVFDEFLVAAAGAS